uniref:PGG domain-containing protein n=1 Tax=Nelumbo nucifera TaxID=4432 RepID=A0A822XU68_NELNU|nr:TPA_asm: hypothetical protein HUJ06_023909 [Nelumbo nucifera]
MSPGAFMLLRAICQQIATVGNIEVGDEYDVDDKDMKALIIDALFRAVQKGNVDFIVEILRYRPRIAQLKNNEGMTLFHEAIRCRKDKIFQLINDFDIPTGPAVGDYRDRKTNNNALHLVAELPPVQRRNHISGAAALQLRKEIVWFRKVQAILPPLHQQAKNMDNKTPRMLFNDSHKELFKEGEEWMKQTAEACMVVATLVASVMLSATLALPGATKSDSGISIFIDRYNFNTFVMTNLISLLFSSSSLIAFLSIYITRFAEQDFLVILPWILCIGLLFLYISIASMIANFMSTILMVLRHEMKWVMIPPACLAILPIAILSMRQLPALFQMMLSTYSLGIFTQQKKRLNI